MKLSEMNFEEKKKDIQQNYNDLKNCSSDELFSRLSKEVEAQKRNGTFDYEGLKKTIENIQNYLPRQTYENMMRIIENLK